MSVLQPQVVMSRVADGDNAHGAKWLTLKPDGNPLDVGASNSSGWLETIQWANEHGYDFQCFGSGLAGPSPNGQNVGVVGFEKGVTLPPGQGVQWTSHASLNFGGSTPDLDAALTFDSLMCAKIALYDQVVVDQFYKAGVRLRPALELPQDLAGPVITSSQISLPSIAMQGTIGPCIEFDDTVAPTGGIFFEAIEPLGGEYGALVRSGGHGFLANHVRIVGAHAQTVCGLQLGEGPNAPQAIRGNFIDFQCEMASGIGCEIWGVGNVIRYQGNTSAAAIDIKFEASAEKNIVIAADLNAQVPIVDNALKKSNRVDTPTEYAKVHRNGASQTIPHQFWTKVLWTHEDEDTVDSFDLGTSRFIASYGGLYDVRAHLRWASVSVGALIAVAIYVNDNLVAQNSRHVASSNGGEGLPIDEYVRLAHGDRLEVFAWQDSGVARDISGSPAETRLSIRRAA